MNPGAYLRFLDHCQIKGHIRFYKAEGTLKSSYLRMLQNRHGQEKENYFQEGSQCLPTVPAMLRVIFRLPGASVMC
jgi:hypothetical protein